MHAILSIQKNTAKVVNMAALNQELADYGSVGNLMMGSMVDPDDPFFNSKWHMLDAEDGSYRSAIDVYACWHLSDMKIISKHIVSGEIIFQRSCSGGDVDFYKVEPGKAKKFNPFK